MRPLFSLSTLLSLGVVKRCRSCGSDRAGWGGSGCGGGAGGAQAPVDDLGLVDRVAVVVRRGEAGCVADGAVDVGDLAARAAHHVMVVVPDAGLVARHGAGGLDAA